MKQLFTILLFTLLIIRANSQTPIMVCNGNGTICTPYYSLNEAIHAANANDFIYLPGGTFQLDSMINKPLNIIGAGCRPDSSAATGTTIINGNLIVTKNASGSLFEGFIHTGEINTPDTLRDCLFRRINSVGFAITGYIEACVIEHCILKNEGITMKGSGCWISNSILTAIYDLRNSIIEHCIFYGNNNIVSFSNCHYSSFSHCIFLKKIGSPNEVNIDICMMYNVYLNGAHGGSTYVCDYDNTPANSVADVFQNPAQITDIHSIQESALQVLPSLIGNNTVRGLYGGSTPWKPGMVPGNPHIYFKQISSNTNQNGELPVLIKVRTEN